MLPALAPLDALKARLALTLDEADEPRAQAALDDASALIRAEAGGTTWVDDDGELLENEVPDIVVTLTLKVAKRSIVNPDDVAQEGAGSYTVSFREVYLTSDEKRLIRQAAGVAPHGGIGVLAVTRGPLETGPVNDVLLDDAVENTDPYQLWP